MRFISKLVVLFICINTLIVNAQILQGKITSDGVEVPFVTIIFKDSGVGVSSNEDGFYKFEKLKKGYHQIIASSLGMIKKKLDIDIKEGLNVFDIDLKPSIYNLDQVVVTGTKTFKRRTQSTVIVNVIDSRQLENVQACNLAEGLKFQPGLRVETDCQTCNYTQLRMNGLTGGYSQILINGRAIFSPLTGLYGMEQIPTNMIDRIEVVRGGGSSLYGSSAIGGIVNVITKIPTSNNYSLGYDFSIINGDTQDKVIWGNATVISGNKNSGATFFVNNRNRGWYDHNGDNFSELPSLRDNTFGATLFLLPSKNQKLEANLGSIHEYRYGGEMIDGIPHFSMQSEERVHDVLLGNLDYQINFNDARSSFIAYLAALQTNRTHYTGIRPESGSAADVIHLENPPYGTSLNTTKQAGFQINHTISKFFGPNMLTIGSEVVADDVMDEISTYNYLVDQKVVTQGVFFQSDWELTKSFNLLSGARFDKHSLLDNIVVSPRLSFLYKLRMKTQFRLTYSTGFRAPQAFDTDLHMAFSGGGISRIILADDLKQERSKSLSASVNYDRASEQYVYGFTFEGFYTHLKDAFYQDPSGSDSYGDIFVKRNGAGARVKGLTMEFRVNFMQKVQLESGLTLQQSLYDEAVEYSDNLPLKKEFLRSPDYYGYATISYNPSPKLSFAANLVHTGAMSLIHLEGVPGQLEDEFLESPVFNAIGIKSTYIQILKESGIKIEYSVGVKNLTNDFQQEFDSSKNRDSNFIYGPSLPRTIYFGLTLKSI
ncbi:TonB-dependent receptor [Flavobacteriales bacterium]|nr:TonB-dependent receptor [Flavobacteriales bacterium]